MAPLLITCTGTATVQSRAEIALVHLTISSEGASQPGVSHDVAETATALQSHLKTLSPPDGDGGGGAVDPTTTPITRWTLSSLSTASWTPLDGDGHALPRRFSASTRLEVHFRDFAALGAFTARLAETAFVGVDRVEWLLTEGTRLALGRRCRREAVEDAVLKARDYADAAGKAGVEVREVSDVLGGGGAGGERMMMARFAEGGGGGEVRFQPEDVSVSCEVVAKFDAA